VGGIALISPLAARLSNKHHQPLLKVKQKTEKVFPLITVKIRTVGAAHKLQIHEDFLFLCGWPSISFFCPVHHPRSKPFVFLRPATIEGQKSGENLSQGCRKATVRIMFDRLTSMGKLAV